MRNSALAALLAFSTSAAVAFSTHVAHATASIGCTGIGETAVSAEIAFGTLPVLSIAAARFETPGGDFAMPATHGATEVVTGDAAFLDDGLVARFTDPNFEKIVVELRILEASEGDTRVSVGTLKVPGQGVFALRCEGP